jgi:hypothetical protein
MATLATTHPTLLDVSKRLDPDGDVAKLVEILNMQNEVLEDMTYIEANEFTGHRSSIRTGLPAPTWRKLYGGVQPTKSTSVQVTDSMGMMEAYAEVDKALADLNGNAAAWRMSEDLAHIEGMNQDFVKTLFYGDESVDPEKYTGLAPRYNSLAAANGQNILSGGGTGADNTSIWLVVWGPNTVFGIYPKGSEGGLQVTDKGQVTIENIDGLGGRMEGYRTHYRWDCGVVVRDWRYVIRIPNIDLSDLSPTEATGAKITDLMVQAIELIPSLSMGRPVFYVSRTIRSMLRRQIVAKTANSTLSLDNVAGKHVVSFDGIPVRRVDGLLGTETQIT